MATFIRICRWRCSVPTRLAARADSWAIEHVTLIDGVHAPQSDMTVAIEGETIASVGASALAHAKGKRIDGTGKYLMPGLIDVHIHLRGGFDVGGKVDAELAPPNREEGVAALASYLFSGVTTVFDAGNRADHILPLRADERERIQMGDNGSYCAPESLRRRTEQRLGRGDSFDHEHRSAAEWASPAGTYLRPGDGLCRCRLLGWTA